METILIEPPNLTLRADAAGAFIAARSAYHAATGVTLDVTNTWGAYRTYQQQVYLYDQYQNHGGALAARPGTSVHEKGLAVDIYNHGATGLQAHMGRYGFRRTVPTEPWHYEYTPGGWAGTPDQPAQPTVTIRKDEDMTGFIRNSGGTIAVVNPLTGYKRELKYAEWASYEANGAKYAQLDDSLYNQVPKAPTEQVAAPGGYPTAQQIASAIFDEQAKRMKE